MLENLFYGCCDVCVIGANKLGLTYGEFCILMFCYIQPLVMLLAGLLNIKHLIGKLTVITMIFYLCFYSQYSITTESFYRIYDDLHNWAAMIGVNYIQINILLYIIIPVLIVVINSIHIKSFSKRRNEAQIK